MWEKVKDQTVIADKCLPVIYNLLVWRSEHVTKHNRVTRKYSPRKKKAWQLSQKENAYNLVLRAKSLIHMPETDVRLSIDVTFFFNE